MRIAGLPWTLADDGGTGPGMRTYPMSVPPLWKALVCCSAALSGFFALLGLIGADGSLVGAMTGIGILVLIHFAPFLDVPAIDPVLTLGIIAVLVAAAWGCCACCGNGGAWRLSSRLR